MRAVPPAPTTALALAMLLALLALAAAFVLAAPSALAQGAPSRWLPLHKDGVHDPKSPALRQLQQPADALASLPPDSAGNLVNWVRAIETGAIDPRTNLFADTKIRTLDQDIIVSKFGSMPAVKFPHRQHTLWLDCSNCHPKLFAEKAGSTKLSMSKILDGEQCGLCHGAVAFPLTECNRCHSVSNESLRRSTVK